jgi:hypothetical protein
MAYSMSFPSTVPAWKAETEAVGIGKDDSVTVDVGRGVKVLITAGVGDGVKAPAIGWSADAELHAEKVTPKIRTTPCFRICGFIYVYSCAIDSIYKKHPTAGASARPGGSGRGRTE